jgi:hypothetical protein
MRMLMKTLYDALKLRCVAVTEELVNDCALADRHIGALNKSMS